MGGPAGQIDHRLVGADAAPRSNGLEVLDIARGRELNDPRSNLARPERHSDNRADPYRVREFGRHDVIELLVEPRDVGYNPGDQRPIGHVPTAARKASSLVRCSQVKAFRSRPK